MLSLVHPEVLVIELPLFSYQRPINSMVGRRPAAPQVLPTLLVVCRAIDTKIREPIRVLNLVLCNDVDVPSYIIHPLNLSIRNQAAQRLNEKVGSFGMAQMTNGKRGGGAGGELTWNCLFLQDLQVRYTPMIFYLTRRWPSSSSLKLEASDRNVFGLINLSFSR